MLKTCRFETHVTADFDIKISPLLYFVLCVFSFRAEYRVAENELGILHLAEDKDVSDGLRSSINSRRLLLRNDDV